MRHLRSEKFICLDCEFTGLDLETDRVIEIAAARFTLEGGIEDRFQTLIDPQSPITKEAEEIHHISQEMLLGQPTADKVLKPFFDFIGDHWIVGHGVIYDLQMLQKETQRYSMHYPLSADKCIDTLRLARHYGDSPSNSLSNLAKHFNVPIEQAHRAMDDVEMNIGVFKQLVARFSTLGKVQEVLSKPIEMKAMPLGKHKGRPFSEIPLQYLRWAAQMDFDQDLLFSIRREISRRKKGGGFAQATNPFSELD
jgi:DNA polymerase III subunit epsilon